MNKVLIGNLVQLEDGLNIGEIEAVTDPEVDDQALLAEFPEISNILSQIIKHPSISEMPINIDFNSADSVAYHLAGLIPISPMQKQTLLEAFDSKQRMNILAKLVNKISENSA